MHLSLIVAVADNGVIGSSAGQAVWNLPADLQHFRETTIGHTIIMGRKTYAKIGHPLAERRNIIVTRQGDFLAPGCEVVTSLPAAYALVGPGEEAFITGGGELYQAALPDMQTLYVTHVHLEPEGDIYFRFNPADWSVTDRQDFPADRVQDFPAYSFITYQRA